MEGESEDAERADKEFRERRKEAQTEMTKEWKREGRNDGEREIT